MSRLVILYAMQATLGIVCAQQTSSYRVVTSVPGAEFYVDGQRYQTAANFLWPDGSNHVLWIKNAVQSVDFTKRYTFNGWSPADGAPRTAAQGLVLAIVAHPEVPAYTASFSLTYQVGFQVNGPPGVAGDSCDVSSSSVNAECVINDTVQWVAAGSELVLAPIVPMPGWVFKGWAYNGPPALSVRVIVNSPMKFQAFFAPARRIVMVTSPPGLKLIVNRTVVPSSNSTCVTTEYLCPGEFDFAVGSKVLMAAPEMQRDEQGRPWVLNSFSIGGGQNTLYTVESLGAPQVITANFVRAIGVDLRTNPIGLKLDINGRNNWFTYSFWWGIGTRNHVSAPPEQADSKGRRYVFRNWSNGGEATQEVVPTEAEIEHGLYLIANYDVLGRLTLNSNDSGATFTVDGSVCRTPCVIHRPAGSEVRILPSASFSTGDGARADFAGWGDGGPAERVVKMGSDDSSLSANYMPMYRVTASSDPASGASFRYEPASADGFYSEGTPVSVKVEVKPGFRFRRWSGDLSGTYAGGTMNMVRPFGIVAMLDRIPYIEPAGVQNAAGETPDAVVAPGSIISIYGESLGTEWQVGNSNPLAQAIGGVSVRLGDRILPLLFVSPQQINAQLPSDVEEGTYSLTIITPEGEQVASDFTVARNAPGLFSRMLGEQLFALASHADGAPVTLEMPARLGEVITLFGTGFGPYERKVVDGFIVSSYPEIPLAEPVEVLTGDQVFVPEWCGAAPGHVGLTVTRFRVPDAVTPGTILEMAVRVGSRSSNVVRLPIQ